MANRLVTVFGGSGFVGRHTVRLFAADGDLVRVAVRSPDDALFLKPMGDVGQVTPVAASIQNERTVAAACEGADAVINLVGILNERGSRSFQAIHVDGARMVAEAARKAGATKFVHLSALGAGLTAPSRYLQSKALGEQAVREAFPDAVIIRPSIVFGPEDEFFNRFASLSRLMPALPVLGVEYSRDDLMNGRYCGNEGTKFQPVYVGDLAAAIHQTAATTAYAGETFEAVGPNVYTFKALMEMVMQATRRRRLLAPVPLWAANIMATFAGLLPNPPITRDQVRSLSVDNVATGECKSLADLGIVPSGPGALVETYLDTYRVGGRFDSLRT